GRGCIFGYVTPLKSELKIKEYNVFRGYYCGVCTALGKLNYLSKYVLNYDLTFLALFLSSIEYDSNMPKRRFCIYNLGKVSYFENPCIDYAAEMNILLTNRKLLDDYNDERNVFALVASKILRLKNSKDFKEKVEAIDKNLAEISSLEREKSGDIDKMSHLFGKVTEEIFNILDGKSGEILRFIGYNLGRWIYVVDAFDDLADDVKKDKYNPMRYAFGYDGEKIDEFRERIVDNVRFMLYSYLENITKAYELLDIKKNKGILDNIIYVSLADKTERLLEGESVSEKRSVRGARCRQERIDRRYKESI
ncbi:MAG TPA: DUF5685 family protein, partial [Fervidobacterium sp.]|nr:DUF5685 family protein [Fervidobacterium sp.]HQE49543.1 DUF5685 family protein [Fervidobacterium sp.]HUM44225.1 DUF5685 family protein [Fervidobacterium sp.]